MSTSPAASMQVNPSGAAIYYRPLPKYKYQLCDDYRVNTTMRPATDISTEFIDLTSGGKLTIKRDYAWDGPSGPTIDTPNFMRGSLVHDALYQLMRLKNLDYRRDRKTADQILHDICREDGMSAIRAWVVLRGVRMGGESSARPPQPELPKPRWAPRDPQADRPSPAQGAAMTPQP